MQSDIALVMVIQLQTNVSSKCVWNIFFPPEALVAKVQIDHEKVRMQGRM